MLAPEERHGDEFLAMAEHVECRGLPLPLGNHPMLDPNVLATVRIWPPRNVAGREDPRRARFQKGVHDDTAIDAEPSLFGEPDPRSHADAGDNEIRRQRAAAAEFHRAAVDAARGVLEMEYDAILLMEGADEVAHLRTQDPLHGPFVRRHDMNFDIARAQGRGNFQANETGAKHDGAARSRGSLDDRLAIGERAQRVDMWLVGAGDGQANRFGSGRKQQPVVGNPAPVGEYDLARARIDAGDVRIETQVDIVLCIKAFPAQRNPILRRFAGEIVLGKIGPINRRRFVVAEHDDAALILFAPQSFGRGETGRAAADNDDLLGNLAGAPSRGFGAVRLRFSPTNILSSRSSTDQQASGLKAGARRASPVRKSKHA